jgi:hypothetical protein
MGLIGGMARTAVAAGTWTAVSNRVSRRQANKWAAQDQQQYYQQAQYQPPPQYQQPPQQYQQPPQQYYQQPAATPAPAAAVAPTTAKQLKDLADLKAQGVLSEEEFTAAKARIIGA